jgi:hypothetical protein
MRLIDPLYDAKFELVKPSIMISTTTATFTASVDAKLVERISEESTRADVSRIEVSYVLVSTETSSVVPKVESMLFVDSATSM